MCLPFRWLSSSSAPCFSLLCSPGAGCKIGDGRSRFAVVPALWMERGTPNTLLQTVSGATGYDATPKPLGSTTGPIFNRDRLLPRNILSSLLPLFSFSSFNFSFNPHPPKNLSLSPVQLFSQPFPLTLYLSSGPQNAKLPRVSKIILGGIGRHVGI